MLLETNLCRYIQIQLVLSHLPHQNKEAFNKTLLHTSEKCGFKKTTQEIKKMANGKGTKQ